MSVKVLLSIPALLVDYGTGYQSQIPNPDSNMSDLYRTWPLTSSPAVIGAKNEEMVDSPFVIPKRVPGSEMLQ
jgi:hypothetical protein